MTKRQSAHDSFGCIGSALHGLLVGHCGTLSHRQAGSHTAGTHSMAHTAGTHCTGLTAWHMQYGTQCGTRLAAYGVLCRSVGWDRQLRMRLGQLGLTSADVARLLRLRMSAAARSIQRCVRAWLARVRRLQQLEEAKQRAASMQKRLR